MRYKKGKLNFSGHDLHLKTERLLLRPFEDGDFDLALPFYQEPEFLNGMEGDPPDVVTRDYLVGAGESMARQGYLFAIVEKATGRTVGEVCLEWMNLDRANVQPGEKVMRLPIGIWDKALWGRGYGKEVVQRLMAYAFEDLQIDRFCAMDVKADNKRSQALWRSHGLAPVREVDGVIDFEISAEGYDRFKGR